MLSAYQHLLWLYPSEHRRQFGDEMSAVFQDVSADIATQGISVRTIFLVREAMGLIGGALREHLRALTILDSIDSSLLLPTRRFHMRNGFRFPKTTAILMTIILLGVLVAIRKGEAIAYSLPHVSEPIAPIHEVHSGLLSEIPWFFAAFYALGIIGWAILFALRRSGVHRLADISDQLK